jgi:hypothetical protein
LRAISEVVGLIMAKMKETNSYKNYWLEQHWLELAGVAANKHSRPQRIDKEILYVRVDSSVWNYNLFILKKTLIKKINQSFGCLIIKDIKYHMGEIKNEASGIEIFLSELHESESNRKMRFNTFLSERKMIECLKKKTRKKSYH